MSSRYRVIAVLGVAAAAAWIVSAGNAQPVPKDKPKAYTAFPELKVPRRGDMPTHPDDEKLFARLHAGRDAIVKRTPENASPLHKVRVAQMNEGIAHITKMKELLRIGRWVPTDFVEVVPVIAETYRIGADLCENPADKIMWFEERVVMLKFWEEYADVRHRLAVDDPPQVIHLARFHRLRAEAELLEFKAELDKARKK